MKKATIYLLLVSQLFVNAVAFCQSIPVAQGYLDHSNYKKAIPIFMDITKEALQQKNLILQITAQNGLADCFTDLGAYYKSNEILKENIKLLNQTKSKNYELYAATYLLQIPNYDNLFLLEDYLKSCNSYYFYIKKAHPDKEIYKALYYSYLGRYHSLIYLPTQATYYTTTALKIYHKNIKDASFIDAYKIYNTHTFSLRNAETSFSIKNKFVDSLTFLLNKRYPYDNLKKTRLIISRTANNLDKACNYDNNKNEKGVRYANIAVQDYDKGKLINDKLIGFNYIISSRFNDLSGLINYYNKDYSRGLKEYDEGIARISDPDLLGWGFSASNFNIISLIRQKYGILKEQNETNHSVKKQLEIIATLLLMEKIWDKYLRDQVISKRDIITNMYNENPYPFLFQAYVKLLELTKDKKYYEKIHEYNEKSKYYSLLLTATLTPNLAKEKELLYNKRQEIHLMYDDYMLAKNMLVPNQNLLKEKLKAAIQSYNAFEANTRVFKQSRIVTIKEIQNNLKKEDAVVSYSNSANFSSNYYAEIITKNQCEIVTVNSINTLWVNNGFQEKDITTTTVFNNGNPSFKVYGNEMYRLVFKNVANHLPSGIKHIEIIPNTELSNIPFEMFLTNNATTTNYKKLPYLMLKYNISYSLSASISRFNSLRKHNSTQAMSVFSPIFDNQKLSKLEFSNTHAKTITAENDATLFEGKNATVATFKKQVAQSKVVAIFSHGVSHNNFDDYKKGIYFTDGFLNLSSIYDLKSNCDLMILGACESGFGIKEKGEGNISLARPLSSIGVKSFLLASWKIDEVSSVTILHSFFNYLNEGFSKSEALQKAKIDFLATASPTTANPVYWAGLTITGNNEPLALRKETGVFWGYLWLILPFGAGVTLFIKRRK